MSTPHELRADLLRLAREILENNAIARRNKRAIDGVSFPNGDEEITTEQVVAEAQKLNEFVSFGPSGGGFTRESRVDPKPDTMRGLPTKTVKNVVVKINGVPFLLNEGRLSSQEQNWNLAGLDLEK